MDKLRLDTTLSWNVNTHEILVCKIHLLQLYFFFYNLLFSLPLGFITFQLSLLFLFNILVESWFFKGCLCNYVIFIFDLQANVVLFSCFKFHRF
jgi:hypothetical protein